MFTIFAFLNHLTGPLLLTGPLVLMKLLTTYHTFPSCYTKQSEYNNSKN